jgi:prepilin-type N-terminal cleavage/methylation domain-containing protein
MSTRSRRGFTLIELLVVIAIIGILSAIVLGSLGLARTRGGDAAVKANLDTVRTQAGVYNDANSNKYSNTGTAVLGSNCGIAAGQTANTMLAQTTIAAALSSAYRTVGGTPTFYCNIDAAGAGYAIAVPLVTSGTWWCIDSSGSAQGTQGGGTTGYTGISGSATAALSGTGDLICN